MKAQIYSNAPAGFYKYKYPKEIRAKGVEGAKVNTKIGDTYFVTTVEKKNLVIQNFQG